MMCASNVLVPKFDLSAPGRVPVLVQVEQDVQPAVEPALPYVVEVDVDIKAAARAGLVDAAPDELATGAGR